jgi:hypothetical protein
MNFGSIFVGYRQEQSSVNGACLGISGEPATCRHPPGSTKPCRANIQFAINWYAVQPAEPAVAVTGHSDERNDDE